MTEVELLETTDARIWAEEFNKVAIKLGYPKMDEGWLIAWFANAMCAQEMATRRNMKN
jgi:hypothetical protein